MASWGILAGMDSCCTEEARKEQKHVFQVVLAVNAAMFCVEGGAGILAQSTALLGDSLDMLGPVVMTTGPASASAFSSTVTPTRTWSCWSTTCPSRTASCACAEVATASSASDRNRRIFTFTGRLLGGWGSNYQMSPLPMEGDIGEMDSDLATLQKQQAARQALLQKQRAVRKATKNDYRLVHLQQLEAKLAESQAQHEQRIKELNQAVKEMEGDNPKFFNCLHDKNNIIKGAP